MDPNETLKEMLRLAGKLAEPGSYEYATDWPGHDAERLAELVLALDEWLSDGGGFYPAAWLQWRFK